MQVDRFKFNRFNNHSDRQPDLLNRLSRVPYYPGFCLCSPHELFLPSPPALEYPANPTTLPDVCYLFPDFPKSRIISLANSLLFLYFRGLILIVSVSFGFFFFLDDCRSFDPMVLLLSCFKLAYGLLIDFNLRLRSSSFGVSYLGLKGILFRLLLNESAKFVLVCWKVQIDGTDT